MHFCVSSSFRARTKVLVTVLQDAGATALRGVRGDLPGRSERARGAANPCGNLPRVSMRRPRVSRESRHTVVLNLLIVLDRHFGDWCSNAAFEDVVRRRLKIRRRRDLRWICAGWENLLAVVCGLGVGVLYMTRVARSLAGPVTAVGASRTSASALSSNQQANDKDPQKLHNLPGRQS